MIAQRAAVAAIAGCIAAVFFYALLRGIQLALFPEANPATVIWSAHAGYFWRIWIVVYLAGMTGFLTYLPRDPGSVARFLVPGVTVAAVAIVLQAALAP